MGLRKTALSTVSSVLIAGAVLLQPNAANARPLLDELQVLLDTSPALRARLEEANARRQDIAITGADAEPFIQVTGETGFEHTALPSNDQYRNAVGVSVTQNLYDGDGTQNRVLASILNERVGHMDLQSTQNALLMEGVQSYINVVLQNRLVGISKRNVEIIDEITNFISRERALGRMTLADHLQSRARLQQSKDTLISFEGARDQSIARYKTLFGQPPELQYMQDPQAPTSFIPGTLNDALQYAVAHNPAIEGAKLSADMVNAQRVSLDSSILPKVDLVGTVDIQNDYDGADGMAEEGTLLVKLNWNLFDGNRTMAAQMAATNRESAAIATLNQIELDVIEQTTMAWNGMVMHRKRAKTLRDAEAIALEAYDARYSLMVTGKDTIITVLDTALEVLNVRTSKTTAEYRYRLSVYRLLNTMGRLAPDTITSIITTSPLDMGTSNAISPSQLAPADLIAAPITPPATTGTGSISADLFNMTMGSTAPAAIPVEPVQQMATTQPPVAYTTSVNMQDGYYVILSANRQEKNAIKTMRNLNLQGISILNTDVKGAPMYMVVVGPLSEPEARLVQGEAFGAGVLDAWLKKSNSL